MFFTFATFLLAPLFVFGVYHLLTWFNFLRINQREYWKRVATASAICHVLLATGFLIFSYIDFRTRIPVEALNTSYGTYLFNRSNFWWLMTVFDTAPMLVLLAGFSTLDRMGINPPGLLIATFGVIYIVGSLQWYWIGAGIGALLERFWEGLKTGDEQDEDWL